MSIILSGDDATLIGSPYIMQLSILKDRNITKQPSMMPYVPCSKSIKRTLQRLATE